MAGAILAGVLALGALGALTLYLHRLTPEERGLLDRAPEAAADAGCTEVREVPPYPGGLDRAHVGSADVPAMPPLEGYPSAPPASGPHGGSTLPDGVYPSAPPIDAAIHSLEHGAVIVWYDPQAEGPEVDEVRRFFEASDEGTHVIVAPFDYPAEGQSGTLPAGTAMALTAWHRLQSCRQASLPVAFAFAEAYRFNLYRWGAYRGDAPERFAPI